MRGEPLDVRHHTAAIMRDMQKLVVLAPSWAAKLGPGALYDLAADPSEDAGELWSTGV